MRKLSVRNRILLLFAGAMLIAMALTFLLVYIVSASVMKKTLSDYLMSAVDTNADKLVYLTKEQAAGEMERDTNDLFVDYADGVLQIDDDFLEILNDVESALYTEEGELLYGDNSLSREMEGEAFTGSRLYEKRIQGERYVVYDRKFTGKKLDGLWIRGIVPLTRQEDQLAQITKSVLAFLPVMLLLVVAGSVLAAKGILQPIRQMEQTAAGIVGGEDLGRRIAVGKNKDELHSLAMSFNAMFDRLEQSFARERQFTSDASHELRTPLAVILTQAEYVAAKERSREEYKDAFTVVERQAKRMKRLVGDMLDLSRIAQGERRYPMETVSLSAIVSTVCEDMERIAYNDITIEANVAENVRLKGNADLLERLLVNLLDNAYKYGKTGGRTQVFLEEKDNVVSLKVRDDGTGISEGAKANIFDRFYREEEARSGNGYGLGLSLAAEIVQLHGGEISVESEKGAGSCFTITFPRERGTLTDSRF